MPPHTNASKGRRAKRALLWGAGLVLAAGVGTAVRVRTSVPAPFFFDMVRLPEGFWVARYEVTQAQYETVTAENPSEFRDPAKPVDSVSWEDAEAFCARLTAREHAARRLPDADAYELPTDAQWDQLADHTDVADAVTSIFSAREGTEQVGVHKPNALGLYDVVGNVWEWTRDWYDNDIRRKDANRDLPATPTDAEAAAQGPEETFKVLRGGAWDTGPADHFSLASRLRYAPGMSNYRTGFRCVVITRAHTGAK